MDSYKRDELRRKHSLEMRRREREAREAPKVAYLARLAAAQAVALAELKASPDYTMIVKYLADLSEAELPHIVMPVFLEDMRGNGCQLSEGKIKRFLDELGLRREWVYNGEALRKVPHGSNCETSPEYPLDVEEVWGLWSWTPSEEFEQNNQ